MRYSIGLDCGIASVGYCVMCLDEKDEPYRIYKLGSRIFPKAESTKGESLALARRTARSSRRRIRRHQHRLERIRRLILREGLLTEEQLNHLFDGRIPDIYELRVQALDRPLTQQEFSRVLLHIAQRRGFKSNRKQGSENNEAGELLSAVAQNQQCMMENGYRTVGEMLFKDGRFQQQKRNKDGNYQNVVLRQDVEREVCLIFDAQKNMGNPFATDSFCEAYIQITFAQRDYDEGPGDNSPYSGNSIERMVGNCTFFNQPGAQEKRAPKATYSYQMFSLYQAIRNLQITSDTDNRILNAEQRDKLFQLAHQKPELTYTDLRKLLGLSENERFSNLSYGDKTTKQVETKTKFRYLDGYHTMRKALESAEPGYFQQLTQEQLDTIGTILTYHNSEKHRLKHLEPLFPANISKALSDLPTFSKFSHLSIKALRMLIPYMAEGMRYDEACEKIGFVHSDPQQIEKKRFLPAVSSSSEAIVNPVVRRAVSQTIKVINAIIREMQESPVCVHIELARELSKTFEERDQISKQYDQNQALNEKIKEELIQEHRILNPRGEDIVKLKLWKEQNGICLYSGKAIPIDRLFEDGLAEVDHIIPYSISFDDSYHNKVLVYAKENREKKNRLPLQYMTSEQAERFTTWVTANVRDYKKRQHLLKTSLSESEQKEMKQRSLQDTQYLSRFLQNYVRAHLLFAPSVDDKPKSVICVNGIITGYLRKRWGISKIRENGDLHHAADAAVICCVTDRLIQLVTRYLQYNEGGLLDEEGKPLKVNEKTGEVSERFPLPYSSFRKELDIRLSEDPSQLLEKVKLPNYTAQDIKSVAPCFVSRMPNHKCTGAAHDNTICGAQLFADDYMVSKEPLTKLKLDKNGAIQGYYRPEDDRLLYEYLLQRLCAANGNAKKAFGKGTPPVHKPKADGTNGPIVKKVKIKDKSTLGVLLNEGTGIAGNSSMVRLDIFCVPGEGYYGIPIYVADAVKNALPDKACVGGKPAKKWKLMKEEHFCFSLFSNDLLLVESSREINFKKISEASTLPPEHKVKKVQAYFSTFDIATASIALLNHDNTYKAKGVGIKSLVSIQKLQVDVLGNINVVTREPRQCFR